MTDESPAATLIFERRLKKTFDVAHQHLYALIQASINIAHFPAPFKTTTTVILRKPVKPDYVYQSQRLSPHRIRKHTWQTHRERHSRITQSCHGKAPTNTSATLWRKTREDGRGSHDNASGEDNACMEGIFGCIYGCRGRI